MSWLPWKINSWIEFTEFVERLRINEDGDLGWFLRGQADSSWGLESSLLRLLKAANLDVKKACGIEKTAFRRFYSQAHLHLKPDMLNRDKWSIVSWWMLMQHYSCPTRLIDWTESPYVAAYFAVEQQPEKDGAIWLFPSTQLETLVTERYGKIALTDDDIYSNDGSLQAVYPAIGFYHSERSIIQQGVFTVCTYVLGNQEELISDAFREQRSRQPLHKLIIPANLKYEFLSRLRTMNISANTLFPGMDGIGRAASELVRLRVWRNS